MNFAQSEEFGIIVLTILTINILLLIYNLIKTFLLEKKYNAFMKNLSNSENIEESLKNFFKNIQYVMDENKEIKRNCKEIEKNLQQCIQKVGLVRYTAFQNTGSDLCFALALLDFEDNGVVINGIYSRENTTNTYAKPVEHGESKYPLVKEEIEAINRAKQGSYKYYINVGEEKNEKKGN